ncbi:hypothetical protein CQ13_37445 [Bradyrhizobium retamae]|uniref:Uncharacterized protein n=1 Tax=Bradyrhizobium retamae TaxID=1300035 RepID=A0A0R3M414_9BRAD|nr:hypothetical protein CQ13_37445 [Bradyrhizobium retamae]
MQNQRGEVHLCFTTDQPLRADRKDIPHDQHPDHQLRIDRRATHRRIMRCRFAAKPGQIESSVDLSHQMIFGNRVAKMKLLEQLTLVTLSDGPSWIDLAKIRVSTTESRFAACLNRLLQQNRPQADCASYDPFLNSFKASCAAYSIWTV